MKPSMSHFYTGNSIMSMRRLNEKIKRNEKQNSLFFMKSFDEYLKNSTLHGLRYIRDPNKSMLERSFWLGVFLLSLIISTFLIYSSWKLWRENPFVVVFDSNLLPVTVIPFPAVTICGTSGMKKSVINLNEINDSYNLTLAMLSCPSDTMYKPWNENITADQEIDPKEVFDFFYNVFPKCEEVIKHCIWKMKPIDCCSEFKPIITPAGVCFIFNTVLEENDWSNSPTKAINWDYERDYGDINNSTAFPYQSLPGLNGGLHIELFQNHSEKQEKCIEARPGFIITLGNAVEKHLSSKDVMKVSLNQEIVFRMSPQLYTVDSTMKGLLPEERFCYHQNERPLQFYPFYTLANCQSECLANRTYTKCSCVSHLMPRNATTPLCMTKSQLKCASNVKEKFKLGGNTLKLSSLCGCLFACKQASYQVYLFNAGPINKHTRPVWASNDTNLEDVTMIDIFYRDDYFLGTTRKRSLDTYTFIGSCCGLLGLFLGFSFISSFELLYYLVFLPVTRLVTRLISNKKTLPEYLP